MLLLLQNIFITILLAFNINLFHAIHISYGEAVLTSNVFHGKITFYKDDFFKALGDWGSRSFSNFSKQEYDHLKLNYLQNNLEAEINNNKKLVLILTEHSEDVNTIWFGFKFVSQAKINSINIKCHLLFNEFSDQMNLLNITMPSGDENLIFERSKSEIEIKM